MMCAGDALQHGYRDLYFVYELQIYLQISGDTLSMIIRRLNSNLLAGED